VPQGQVFSENFDFSCTIYIPSGNRRGLNLAAVKRTTVQVSKTAVVAKATSSRANLLY
jgi:hypothetical protein